MVGMDSERLGSFFFRAFDWLSAVSSPAGRQYYFVYDQKNFTEARRYCREKHTDLATIDNMDNVKTLNSMADLSRMVYSSYSYRAWIGLYDDMDSWEWSLSNASFYKPGGTTFRLWATEEPCNYVGNEHCTEMYGTGLWNDNNCEIFKRAVCIDVTGPNETFILTNMSMKWTQAQSYCRDHHTDLVSVRNTTENQKVRDVAAGNRVWIGLSRESWKWLDGSKSSFRYWSENGKEPNNREGGEACVVAHFNDSGKWEDWRCHYKRAFICYGPVPVSRKVLKVKFENKNNLNLNNPAVMEAMLKQLQQKLRDQGLDQDVRLSWRKQADGQVFHKEETEEKKRRRRRRRKEEL
ncbi:secretory phospholipase A2 receptor isoform X2 [Etheostoma spectabile]|uniref:secretory phospholipase A2 receptor isoform X2 n=1 Tax=Etheostoma spectabile TaxID=54343 RepID=UPI0013AFAFBD|nr:secretory phospholipase A2 receptor-like isoform X2 [Etheostoma spectabile]